MFSEISNQNIRPHLFFVALICAILLPLASCSSLGSKSPREAGNKVSEYDGEFDKEVRSSSSLNTNVSEEEDILARAMDSYERGVYSIAKNSFVKLQKEYPNSYFLPLVELKIADCDFYLGRYTEAIEGYEEYLRMRPRSEAAAYASYKIADAHLKKYRGPYKDQSPLKTAIQKLEELSNNYSNSEYDRLAQRATKEAKEKLAQHDLIVAKFYAKQGMKKAALNRLKKIFTKYPEASAAQIGPDQLRSDFKLSDDQIARLIPEDSTPIKTSAIQSSELLNQSERVRAMLAKEKLASISPSATERSASLSTTESPEIDKPPSLSLSCSEQGNVFIVQALLEEGLKVSEKELGMATHRVTLDSSTMLTVSPLLDSCEASTVYAQAFIKEARLIVELRGIENMKTDFLELDRPNRIAWVLRPKQ
jgi:outer membrane protein assembly factor BamD